MKYKVDVVRIRENSITLNGWVIGKSPESKATFRVEDERHKPVKFKYVPTRRDDVSQIYYKKCYDRDFGFDIRFPYERGKNYFLLIRCEGKQANEKFPRPPRRKSGAPPRSLATSPTSPPAACATTAKIRSLSSPSSGPGISAPRWLSAFCAAFRTES